MILITDEIVHVLSSDPNAELEIVLEIHARFPAGVPEHIKRAVLENAKALKFKTASWE